MKTTTNANEAHAAAIQAAQQRSDRAIGSAIATERAAGIATAQAAITEITAAEVARLEQQITDVREAARIADEQVAAHAEQTRRARAALLASQVFSAERDALPMLIREFRREPARQLAIKVREVWDRLDAIATAELGSAMSEHTLGALFISDALRDPANAPAINLFSVDYGDSVLTRSPAHDALGAFTRKVLTPPELHELLAVVDLAITKTAARARSYGTPPSPYHRERIAARLAHVTRRDLTRALQEIDNREAAAVQAEHERLARAAPRPPTRDEFLSQRVVRMNDGGSAA